MRSNRIYLATAVCGIVLAAASPIRAAEDKKPPAPLGIFSLYVENDVAAGTDRNYTNGVKLLWVSPEIGEGERKLRAPGWIDFLARRLPLTQRSGARRFFSLSLDQSIYTPENITRSVPDASDRPYAGYLYAGLAVHSQDEGSLDSAEIDVGVIGPLSLAGTIQTLWHHTFGWDRREAGPISSRNEPVLALTYDTCGRSSARGPRKASEGTPSSMPGPRCPTLSPGHGRRGAAPGLEPAWRFRQRSHPAGP